MHSFEGNILHETNLNLLGAFFLSLVWEAKKKKIGSSAVKSKQWKETAEEDISGSRGLPAHSTLFALQSKVVSHCTSLQQSRGSENLKATAH